VDFKAGHDGEPSWFQASWAFNLKEAVNDGAIRPENPLYQEVQEENHCGTAYCVAGYAAHKAGFALAPAETSSNQPLVKVEFEYNGLRYSNQSWEQAGQIALGLTYHEAKVLFNGDNSKNDIQRIMNQILASRGEEIRVG